MAWIIDQTKRLSVNLDNCSYIYVESKTKSIKAVLKPDVNGNEVKVHLASYETVDICSEVIECISFLAPKHYHIVLPLGREVQDWIREVRDNSYEINNSQ